MECDYSLFAVYVIIKEQIYAHPFLSAALDTYKTPAVVFGTLFDIFLYFVKRESTTHFFRSIGIFTFFRIL